MDPNQHYSFDDTPDAEEFVLVPAGPTHIVLTSLEPEQKGDNPASWSLKAMIIGGEYHGRHLRDSISFPQLSEYTPGSKEHEAALKSKQRCKLVLENLFDANVNQPGGPNLALVVANGIGKQAVAKIVHRPDKNDKTKIYANVDFRGYSKPDGFQYAFGADIPPAPPGPPQYFPPGMPQPGWNPSGAPPQQIQQQYAPPPQQPQYQPPPAATPPQYAPPQQQAPYPGQQPQHPQAPPQGYGPTAPHQQPAPPYVPPVQGQAPTQQQWAVPPQTSHDPNAQWQQPQHPQAPPQQAPTTLPQTSNAQGPQNYGQQPAAPAFHQAPPRSDGAPF